MHGCMDVEEAYILSPCLLDNIEMLSFNTCLFFWMIYLYLHECFPSSLSDFFFFFTFFFWQSLCSLVILSHTCPQPKTNLWLLARSCSLTLLLPSTMSVLLWLSSDSSGLAEATTPFSSVREGRGYEQSDNDARNPQSILDVYLPRNYQGSLQLLCYCLYLILVNSRNQNPLGAKPVCLVYFLFLPRHPSAGTQAWVSPRRRLPLLFFGSLGATEVFLCLLPSRTCYQATLFCDLGCGYWTQVLVCLFIKYTLYWLSYLSNLEISF